MAGKSAVVPEAEMVGVCTSLHLPTRICTQDFTAKAVGSRQWQAER